jgi:hypothetical protein
MPAFRSASSNDASRSLWIPTPLVKKILVGTYMKIILSLPFFKFWSRSAKKNKNPLQKPRNHEDCAV